MPAKKEDETPGENSHESTPRDSRLKALVEAKKRIKSIYSVNGKYKAQLVKKKKVVGSVSYGKRMTEAGIVHWCAM